MGVVNFPAFNAGTAAFDAQVLSLGGGIQPTERLNLFAYANWFNFNVRGADGLETSIDKSLGQGAIGLSYRFSPTEQTSLKLGRSVDKAKINGYPALFNLSNLGGILSLNSMPRKQFTDLQLHHTLTPRQARAGLPLWSM
jgi:hypothetical protein